MYSFFAPDTAVHACFDTNKEAFTDLLKKIMIITPYKYLIEKSGMIEKNSDLLHTSLE